MTNSFSYKTSPGSLKHRGRERMKTQWFKTDTLPCLFFFTVNYFLYIHISIQHFYEWNHPVTASKSEWKGDCTCLCRVRSSNGTHEFTTMFIDTVFRGFMIVFPPLPYSPLLLEETLRLLLILNQFLWLADL